MKRRKWNQTFTGTPNKLLDRLEETKRKRVSSLIFWCMWRQIYNSMSGQWEAYSSVIYSYIYHKWKKKTLFPKAGIWKRGIFSFSKKGNEGGPVLPLDKAMRASRVLYYLDLLQMCIASTLRRFFPPRPVDSKPRTADTLEVCCCCCQSHVWTKRVKK